MPSHELCQSDIWVSFDHVLVGANSKWVATATTTSGIYLVPQVMEEIGTLMLGTGSIIQLAMHPQGNIIYIVVAKLDLIYNL